MFSLNRSSQKFLLQYDSIVSSARAAAPIIRDEIDAAVAESGLLIHSITARAKTVQSLRGKLRRKSYLSPRDQLTDLVGARVITYYRDAVDPIAERLRGRFKVDKEASVDKRQALGMRQFGYRSVHLIASMRPLTLRPNEFLQEFKFEIQIRSILEHAWAEIEHEIVYKSGVSFNDDTTRRFAALAGGLELFDNEFLALRLQRDVLVDAYARSYRDLQGGRTGFDVARLLGFLEVLLPNGHSWRKAEEEGRPIASGLDASCVEALHAAGLATADSLRAVIKSRKFRGYRGAFAAASGIAPESMSHLAAVILAVAAKKPMVLKKHFPEMLFDANIRVALDQKGIL
jgi:ppGpp synthetase/RelA/SpoT-type nucleotidyltranferase